MSLLPLGGESPLCASPPGTGKSLAFPRDSSCCALFVGPLPLFELWLLLTELCGDPGPPCTSCLHTSLKMGEACTLL